MKSFIFGLVIGLLILPVGEYVYVRRGRAPVATSDPPLPLETSLAKAALRARVNREAPKQDVSSFSTSDLEAGADVYQKNCAFCHGLPQQPATPAAKGMFPDPPQLFTSGGMVTDDPAGVTYWKVKNGIRLSGMPGFKASFGDQQIWQVAALVARADKLPPEVMDKLKPASSEPPTPSAPSRTAPAAPVKK